MNVALLGHGTVGTGVEKILSEKADFISRKAGEEINLKYILEKPDYPFLTESDKYVTDFEKILSDNSVKVIVEAIGGLEPANTYLRAAICRGINAVTSNKELVAEYGRELMCLAEEHNVNFLFEGAVGGTIPIIHSLRNCASRDDISLVAGILNGTTNYILTRMNEKGWTFGEALGKAQELGYAEANPSADVDGIDTCRKICILADIVFGHHIYPEHVYKKGIRDIRPKDLKAVAAAGGSIKLMGYAQKNSDNKLHIGASPLVIGPGNPLGNVSDVFNAVLVRGDLRGDLMFYGRGAGSLPTGGAVVNDIIECAKAKGTLYAPWGEPDDAIFFTPTRRKYFISVKRDTGNIGKLLRHSIANIPYAENDDPDVAFITQSIAYGDLDKLLSGLRINAFIPVFE